MLSERSEQSGWAKNSQNETENFRSILKFKDSIDLGMKIQSSLGFIQIDFLTNMFRIWCNF